jgi:hypothetical protein
MQQGSGGARCGSGLVVRCGSHGEVERGGKSGNYHHVSGMVQELEQPILYINTHSECPTSHKAKRAGKGMHHKQNERG